MATTIPTFLEVVCSPLANVPYSFVSFNGVEYVSRLFEYELVIRSGRYDLDPSSLVEKDIMVRLAQQALPSPSRQWRTIVGIVSSCELATASDGMLEMRLRIVPALARLAYRRNSRIFENATVQEIVEKILTRAGFSSGSDFQFHLSGSYRSRAYCVQYNETDLDFISRLLEDEGIFYYFEHTDQHCVLHLCDAVQNCKYYPTLQTMHFQVARNQDSRRLVWQLPVLEQECYHLAWSERHLPASAAVGNYNHETATPLENTAPLTKGVHIGQAAYYEAPVNVETRQVAERTANIRAEEWEAQASTVHGESFVRPLTAGYLVDIDQHDTPAFNRTYFLTEVHHHCTQFEYWNAFTAIPSTQPYRPLRRTPKPQIHGYLIGRVVGPPGSSQEEIHTNEHGWVKVMFPWAHQGNKDDTHSIFVPVAQLWAGSGYGTMFIPRVGMEAVVAFLDGDPDRPVVIGTVFNPAEPIPYKQPAKKDVSTILTRSTPNGSAGNELRFTDTKDSEEVYLHAQKDWNTLVENDRTTTINHDETLTVKNKRTETIENDNSETYKANMTVEVQKDYTLTIHGNLKISVMGDIVIETNKSLKVNAVQNASVESLQNLQLRGATGVGVESNAAMDLKGININVNAQAALKQSGMAQAELSSAGQTAVRGSIVMIN